MTPTSIATDQSMIKGSQIHKEITTSLFFFQNKNFISFSSLKTQNHWKKEAATYIFNISQDHFHEHDTVIEHDE